MYTKVTFRNEKVTTKTLNQFCHTITTNLGSGFAAELTRCVKLLCYFYSYVIVTLGETGETCEWLATVSAGTNRRRFTEN